MFYGIRKKCYICNMIRKETNYERSIPPPPKGGGLLDRDLMKKRKRVPDKVEALFFAFCMFKCR